MPSSPAALAGKGALPPGLASLFPDPSKLNPEEYNLLQFYEKQLKAAAAAQQKAAAAATGSSSGAAATAGTASPALSTNSTSSTPSKDGGTSGSSKKESKENSKERQKVCKPPPETKRPPSLMQTPCAFVQTSTIYTNPLTEITKLKAAAGKSGSQTTPLIPGMPPSAGVGDALDLSSASLARNRTPANSFSQFKSEADYKREAAAAAAAAAAVAGGAMNLAPTLDLSLKRDAPKHEVKASPFSAEALLSRPSPKPPQQQPQVPPSQQSLPLHFPPTSSATSAPATTRHDLVKIAPMAALTAAATGKSPAGRSPFMQGNEKPPSSSKASPWHTPVPPTTSGASLAALGLGLGFGHKDQAGKPAIPVSPVVREDKNRAPDPAIQFGGLLGASSSGGITPPVSVPSSTSQALAAAAAAAAANPYLALMSNPKAGVPGAGPAAAAAAASGAGYPGGAASALMDPATSAYYAALYSQMYGGAAAGLSPYAAGLGALGAAAPPRHASTPPGAASAAPPPPPSAIGGGSGSAAAAAAALAGLDPLQASALQAMLARSTGAPPPPGSGSGNPYAAAAAAAGYPGIPGFSYPGFPPPRKDP